MLGKVAGNILNDPSNVQKRKLKTTNQKVFDSLVKPKGALDMMFIMGFTQLEDDLVAANDISLSALKSIIRVLPARTHALKAEWEKGEKERIDKLLSDAREESSRARRGMGDDDFNPMMPGASSGSSGFSRPNRRQQQKRGG
jgi:hypothetical protein